MSTLRQHTCVTRIAASVLLGLFSLVTVRSAEPTTALGEVRQDQFQYLFFWKQDDPQTRGMLQVFQQATRQMGSQVRTATVNISDPRQRQIVESYGVGRAPMPLVLSIAPNGAVTKAFPAQFTEAQLREGLVSRCAAQCLKALQDKKLVVLCVLNSQSPHSQAVHQSALQFQGDSRFANATEIVSIDADDAAEESFLRQLQIPPHTADPVTVVLAPPGEQVAKFTGQVTKEQLVSKVAAAQSTCCPGGKCGPNGQCGPGGCCPGGKCGPQRGK